MAKELKPRLTYLVGLGQIREATADKPSASKVYRLPIAKDGFPISEHSTLHELFSKSVAKYSNLPLLGWRPFDEAGKVGEYQWMTYAETAERVGEVASGLAALGLTAGNRVGVYGVNCPEWMLAMQVRREWFCWVECSPRKLLSALEATGTCLRHVLSRSCAE